MPACPPVPSPLFVPSPWDGLLYWVIAALFGALAVFQFRAYRRRLARIIPLERRRLTASLYNGYTLVLLAYEWFSILVLLPSIMRQISWIDSAIQNCDPGTASAGSSVRLWLAVFSGTCLVTWVICSVIQHYIRRLGLPEWGIGFLGRRATIETRETHI